RAQTYQARLAAAVAALSEHDVAGAARHLERAPEELRGWEWRHLHSRLDDRLATIASAPGEILSLLPEPDGIRVGRLAPSGLVVTDLDGQPLRTISFEPTLSSFRVAQQTSAGLRIVNSVENGALAVRDEN